MDASLPSRLQRVMIAVIANDLKVLESHLDSLRTVPVDFPNDEGHHSVAYMLLLLLEKMLRFQREGRFVDAANTLATLSHPLTTTIQPSNGDEQRPVNIEGRPSNQPLMLSTNIPIVKMDDDSGSGEVAADVGAVVEERPVEEEGRNEEEGRDVSTRRNTPNRGTRGSEPRAAKKAVEASTTSAVAEKTPTKCPFCPKTYRSVPAMSTLAEHINEEHGSLPGTFFRCSMCPNVRSRWATKKEHTKSCGGQPIFEHCPDAEKRKGRRAETLSEEGGVPPTKRARTHEVEGSLVARNNAEAQKRAEAAVAEEGGTEGKAAGRDRTNGKEGLVAVKNERPA